jgi:hypothetical protein
MRWLIVIATTITVAAFWLLLYTIGVMFFAW